MICLKTSIGAVAAMVLAAAGPAHADVVYSNIPATLPGNYASLGYQATSTSEFGDHIELAPGGRRLDRVAVTMSSWALASTYGSTDAGYNHSLTLNLYNYVDNTAAGSLITSLTIDAFVPWRPEADADCGNGGWKKDPNGACLSGLAFNALFDFSTLDVLLPDELVVGLAFNTQSYGANPTGVAGPYNSLNFALAGAPTVGTDVNSDGVFWNTANQGFLTPGGGTAGTFGQDTGWTGFTPAIEINASVPEPGSLALAGLAIGGLALARRRRSA